MRRMMVAILLATAFWCPAISFPNEVGATSPLKVTISLEKPVLKLPKNKDEWFAVDFKGILVNRGEDDIHVATPQTLGIFPPPYSLIVNGKEAYFQTNVFWCGGPQTSNQSVITLRPNEERTVYFSWNFLTANFSSAPGRYTVAVRYSLTGEAWTALNTQAGQGSLSLIISDWSNEVEAEVVVD